LAFITHVQARHERSVAVARHRLKTVGGGAVSAIPLRAKLCELSLAHWRGGTRIAPARVPGIFDENAVVLASHRLLEGRLVEIGEVILDEQRHIDVDGTLTVPIIGGLDAPVRRQRVDDQILRPVGVDGAQPQAGSMNFAVS